jgi:hypothetical protein
MRAAFHWSGFLAILAAVLFTGTTAASVCHPDPPGTKTARVPGRVQHYTMSGNRVAIAYGTQRACKVVTWGIFTRLDKARRSRNCAQGPKRPGSHGQVTLVRGTADTPDRLLVDSSTPHAWPLPQRPSSFDVSGQTAVFASDREVYAMRLTDGQVALVGPSRRGDTPQIEAPGVVFQSNLYKRYERSGWTTMKFIPAAAVGKALGNVGKPVDLPGRIEGFSMDGNRIAVGVRPRGECARILFWNVAWRYAAWISDDDELTCKLTAAGGQIRDVAIGGARAEWTIRSGRVERVISASSWACIDRVAVTARMPSRNVASITGDGRTLAFAVRSNQGQWSLGAIGGRMRGSTLLHEDGAPVSLSADGDRLAVLNGDGSVDLRTRDGSLLQSLDGVDATAIALRADRLVALTRDGRLAVYDVATGAQLRTWPLPEPVDNRIDAHFGIAVVTAGSRIYAVSLATGKSKLVATAPAPAQAAIEAPGIAYAYNVGSRGSLRFVPFARVEASLR